MTGDEQLGATRTRRQISGAYASFVAFGFFWGAWGASLPSIQSNADVTLPELGVGLALVGVGALPAMLVAGRLFDRFGSRTGAISLTLLAASGILVSSVANGFASLALLMLVAGAASGASDVSINAAAANAERRSNRPVLTRAHGFFSLAVVVSSLAAGGLGAAGTSSAAIFAIGAVVALVAVAMSPRRTNDGTVVEAAVTTSARLPTVMLIALFLIGVLGALALAVENVHQSWSAVFLKDTLDAAPFISALGPASFAAVASLVRFGAGTVAQRVRPVVLLGIGGAAATVGTLVLATSADVVVAIAGIVVAAAGTAVCFPTLLSIVAAHTDQATRGRVTSAVSSVAYIGFLVGPALVGGVSAASGLRDGLVAAAVLGAVFTVVVIPVVGWARRALERSTR